MSGGHPTWRGEMNSDGRLRIGILGPLIGTWDGAAISLPRGRVAVLLAVLAMSAGRPVSMRRLAELVWAEERPKRTRASLQTLVARLRGAMPGVVVTAADGYLLDVDPNSVDLLYFRRLVNDARAASEPSTALVLLDEALGLWRGEPLGYPLSAALDREVVPGLVEEHLAALEQRAEIELAVGRFDRVLAELQGLISQHPLREPLWGQLIRALDGAGRPAEAIQQYHRARKILATEVGIDPSPSLQALFQRLLRPEPAQPAPGLKLGHDDSA